MKLSKRDKIIHLLNRFGLGANEPEIEKYSAMGVDGAIEHLVDYDKVTPNLTVQPWEFVFGTDGKVAMDPGHMAAYWCYRMVATNRPSEEKQTLFWHNHFAVSGSKVEFGPMMVDYLSTLRKYGNGNFFTLLDAIAKNPAMLRWLDTDRSIKGKPNENFAREVMELFTLGIGNYTEKDIQHAARAFSGWNIRYPYYEIGPMPEPMRVRFAVENDMPMAAFQDSPTLHDNGHKTVLGVTGNLSAEDILTMLAHSPVTAKRMTKKLWEFYAYANPEDEVVNRLAKVWTDSDLDIKKTMFAIADSPEFWSEKSVGTLIKSPVDFAVGAMRQAGAGDVFLKRRAEFASFDQPMDRLCFGDAYVVFRNMANQGLAPLFPPDVSGWRWGAAWVSASATLDRMRFSDFVFSGRGKNSFANDLFTKLYADRKKMTDDQFVQTVLDRFAMNLEPEKKAILTEVVTKSGGTKAIKTPQQVVILCKSLGKLMFGSPEYQLC